MKTLKRIPRTTWIRLAAWISLIATAFVLVRFTPLGELFTEERIVALLTEMRGLWWAPVVLIVLYAVLAPLGLPMSPLLVGGAAFGALYGTLYNLTGLMLGAATSFWTAKHMGRDFIIRVAGKRLRRAERFLAREGFWPLVQARFLPLPFAVTNFGSALAGVRFPLFISASFVGLLPATALQSYFLAKIIEGHGTDRLIMGGLYVAVFLVINLVLSIPSIMERKRRRERYGRLVAQRALRPPILRGPT